MFAAHLVQINGWLHVGYDVCTWVVCASEIDFIGYGRIKAFKNLCTERTENAHVIKTIWPQ